MEFCVYERERYFTTRLIARETYIVWVIGSKSAGEKEMLTEKLQIDTEIKMLARGTSASLSVGDDRRVVQRVKLCVCERKIKKRALDCM